mgnify:CR=1 FL=1
MKVSAAVQLGVKQGISSKVGKNQRTRGGFSHEVVSRLSGFSCGCRDGRGCRLQGVELPVGLGAGDDRGFPGRDVHDVLVDPVGSGCRLPPFEKTGRVSSDRKSVV